MRECCYIYPGGENIVCASGADFAIYGMPEHPEDETFSCEEHLGAMIGTPTWRDQPNGSWRIYSV